MTFPASSKAFSSLRSPTKTLPDFPSAPRLTRTSSLCSTCKQGQGILDQPGCKMMGGLHLSGIDGTQAEMSYLSQVNDRLSKYRMVKHISFHPLAERFGYCPDCQCKDFEEESRHTLSSSVIAAETLHINTRTRQEVPQRQNARHVQAVATLGLCLKTISLVI